MSNKNISKSLKTIIALMGVLGIGFYSVVVPWALSEFVGKYPEFSYFYLPWLIFLLCTAVPLYAILVLGWMISTAIGEDKSFTEKNAERLKACAYCLAGDAVFFLLGNFVFWFLNLNHPGVAVAACVFCSFVIMIACAVRLLAHLVSKASAIREENEGYI